MLFYFDKLIYNNIGDNMKKKIILIIVMLLIIVVLLIFQKKEVNKDKIGDCNVFQNNPYRVIFHSNGGPEVETVEICDTCERSEDNKLPVLAKKDYYFGGWYYDSLFLMKADVKTIDELELSIEKDVNGCDYKYKDIELYALWIKK